MKTRPVARVVGAAALVSALLLSVGGCAPAPSTEASAQASAPASVSLPDTPLGERTAQVLQIINGSAVVSEATLGTLMSEATLAEVSAAEFVTVFTQLQQGKQWILEDYAENAGTASARIHSATLKQKLILNLDLDEAGRIGLINFVPAPPERTPATSWSEVGTELAALEGKNRMRVVELAAGATPLLDEGKDEPLPLGSTFKLFVLGAVIDAVDAGTLNWTDSLEVTAATRSLPSGELQKLPDGATVSVREAAEKMISISDNTATDMLIARVGRDAVERAQAEMGASHPERNTPFLSTRDLFWLGWDADADMRTAWKNGSEQDRRAILEQAPTGNLTVDPTAVTSPVWTFGLDWFASATDLEAAQGWLLERASRPGGEAISEILSANPGLPPVAGLSVLSFKGGSAPGVLAGSWIVERTDGRRFAITMQVQDDSATPALDPNVQFGPVQDAFALVAK